MLFGKPKLPPEERHSRIEETESLIEAKKFDEAYAKACELNRQDSAAASLSLSYFSFMGKCVREDMEEAARYAEKYLRTAPEDPRGWNRLGCAQMAAGNTAQAAESLEKAYQRGDAESSVLLAGACKILADGLRGEAAGTLNVATFAKSNGQAMQLYTRACALYEKIGAEKPGLMDDADWQGYGRCFDMMYALSLNGEAKSLRITDKTLLNYLSATQAFEGGKKDAATQGYWLAVGVRGCALMEQAGHPVLAEYFRAALCLNGCSAKKSEKLVNAKWHLDRAAQLGSGLTAEQRSACANDFADYREAVRQDAEKIRQRDGGCPEKRAAAGSLRRIPGWQGARGGGLPGLYAERCRNPERHAGAGRSSQEKGPVWSVQLMQEGEME